MRALDNITSVKVRNCESVSDCTRNVPNQFIIHAKTAKGSISLFQSYEKVIAMRDEHGQITLDNCYWDYSNTTGKYRNQFLGENIAETRKKIKSGEYKLDDLNE